MLFRFALGTASSDVEEARELHEPPCGASDRTGDALRRIVSSINCFAQLKFQNIQIFVDYILKFLCYFILSSPGPVIWTSRSLAPGFTENLKYFYK